MNLPKVAIGVPYYRVVEGNMFSSALGMAFACAGRMQVVPIMCSGCYVEQNRNGAIEYAMEIERTTDIRFDWFLWLDTDVGFPNDTPLRLIAHDKDIVGANYRIRMVPFTAAGHYADENDDHVTDTGLVPMKHLPTGCLLIRFEVLRHMHRLDVEAAERRMAEYPKLIEMLRERGGNEQAIRDLTERMSPFPDPWFRAPRNRQEPRDDVYFCWRARELGYEIFCDMDLTREVSHRTVQDLPWFDPEQVVVDHRQFSVAKAKEMQDESARATGRELNTAESRGQGRTDGMGTPGERSEAA